MARVYVSSTVADLEPERRAVLDWLVAAGHQPVHSYTPSGESVRESCLDDVGTCDLYVLILSHRYGFVPPGDNPGGLSITQLEFRRAGECGIPRVALLRTGSPDLRLSDLHDPARAALVWAFRAEVEDTVRAGEFSDESGLIRGLSTGIQAELGKQASRPPGRVLELAPRPPALGGREELLAELDARLTGDGGAGPRVVALCGLGGVGKTSVAVEYAHRHLDQVKVAWQFACEDRSVLAAGFGELAAQLGARHLPDERNPVKSVHRVLAGYPAEWLLVFDNAHDRESIADFVPPAGRGRVLITSRNPFWPPGQALEVPVLAPEAAAEFLAGRTDDPDRQVALELAGELGGLPLALEQAAAYIRATAGSLARYLVLLRQRRPDLLARGEPAGPGATVATTWSLAFTQLESAPQAVGLLRLLACCAPEAVPLRLLLQPRPGLAADLSGEVAAALMPLLGDELEVDGAVAALRQYSLITVAGDGLVSVHRLVQAITVDQMPGQLAAAWEQATAAVIEAALPDDPQQPGAWPLYTLLLPHAEAALAADSAGMASIAAYFGDSGSYAAARDLWQKVTEARERALGAEHPATLAARVGLASCTGRAGDVARARDQYIALVPVLEQVLGAGSLETLAARANLAAWVGEAGDVAGARDQLTALVPVLERVLGAEHPETLAARPRLAYWTGWAGDAAAARDQLAALVPVLERVLGAEHPETLFTRGGLATWTGRAGDAAGARDQLTALLPVLERVLGREHPRTLTSRGHLARWTGEAGDAGGARDQLAELLPIQERVFGAEHPDTLTVRNDLAEWTGIADNAAGGRDLFAALVPVAERVLGAEHPATLLARSHLAYWVGEAGNAAGARDQYAALLPVRERVLGPEHLDVLIGRAQYARFIGEAGNAAGARDAYAALLLIDERVLGKEHPHTQGARANLARWTGEAGDPPGARDQYAALLPMREQVLGPEHPQTLYARCDLARWTGEAGDAAGARDQLAALLPVIERVFGPEHPQTQEVRDDLAHWTSRARLRRGAN
jgi:Domain of unknown function (DUF4062)/Tetratricopeptide repeat